MNDTPKKIDESEFTYDRCGAHGLTLGCQMFDQFSSEDHRFAAKGFAWR